MVEMIEKHINLKTRGLPIRIDVVQDTNAVPIEFTLMDYDIPVGAEARIYIRKPSGLEIYNNCTIEENNVIVQPTMQMYAEKGRAKAQLQIVADDVVAASFAFCIDVAENIASSSAVESSNEFGILDALINEAREAVAALGKLKPHAFTAPVQNLTTNVAGSALDATMGAMIQGLINAKINNTMTVLPEGGNPRGAATAVGFYTIYNPINMNISGWFNFIIMKSNNDANSRCIVGLYQDRLYYSWRNSDTGLWSEWFIVENTGLLSDLKTTSKDSVVGAVNEIYDNTKNEAFAVSVASGITAVSMLARKIGSLIVINFDVAGSFAANTHVKVGSIPPGFTPQIQVYSGGHSGIQEPLQVRADVDGTIYVWGPVAYASARGTITYTI